MKFIPKRLLKKSELSLSSFGTKYKKGDFSFICLNITQFLGVLNDNIYKLLTIYFLLSILTKEKAASILSIAGALYVIPFLLFSSGAGLLADRFSKQKLIQILKGTEIIIMMAALGVFHIKSELGCYILLFLLASHSAAFGPSKYGILPELVEKSNLPKANGHLTAFTYLAMVLGTFLASYFTEISDGNFLIGVSFCLFFSVLGFIPSFGIQKTPRQRSSGPDSFFIKEIVETIKEFKRYPLLIPSLFGSAYFLFIGAFTQLNVIPLAISLGLSEYAGGYLFLLTAIGIAVGSFLSGAMLKKKPSLGLSCFAGFMIGIIFVLIGVFGRFLPVLAILLTLIGLFGGMFIISFDTFIQINSPDGKRGQTVASANFLSFLGVLIASICLYIFGGLLGFSPEGGFLSIGIITLITVSFLSVQLIEVFLPFLARNSSFYQKIRIADPSRGLLNGSIFVLEEVRGALIWTVYKYAQKTHLIVVSEKNTFLLKLLGSAPSVHFISSLSNLEEAIQKAKSLQKEDLSVCLILNRPFEEDQYNNNLSFFHFKDPSIYLLRLEKGESENRIITVRSL